MGNRFLLGIMMLLFNLALIGQNQKMSDSLKAIYHSGSKIDSTLQLLVEITIYESSPDSLLFYSDLLIEKALELTDLNALHNGYLQKGNALRLKGDLDHALDAFFKSIDYAIKIEDNKGVGKLNISIADIYSENGNSNNALLYYHKGIDILRETQDSVSLATALNNIGDECFYSGQLDSAIIYTQEAAKIFNDVNRQIKVDNK